MAGGLLVLASNVPSKLSLDAVWANRRAAVAR
jgi:hypothetical protein